MKSLTLLATLFSATAFGAAVQRKQSTEFDVTAFYASCIPHSTFCSYAFNVTTTPGGTPDACSAFLAGPDKLPAVGLTGCADPSVSFSFAIGTNYTLTVTTASGASENVTGTYVIPGDEVIVQNNGAVTDQVYTGPQNFTITDLEKVAA